MYSLHLYLNCLSLRNTFKAISRFVTKSHTAIRDWIQKYKPERLSYNKIKISEFIIDETQLKVGSELNGYEYQLLNLKLKIFLK